MSIWVLVIALIATCGRLAHCLNQWSFQGSLTISENKTSFSVSPTAIFGRGFMTMITGYQSVDSPGIYVHTTDDGYIDRVHNHVIWSQQAKLVARDTIAQDQFGKWMVFNDYTILVSAPNSDEGRVRSAGSVYVFNGTLRHWSQVQKLVAGDAMGNDRFGERMSLHGDRVVISASGFNEESGAMYVFERNPKVGGVFWSRQSKLMPRDALSNQAFAGKISLFGEHTIAMAKNDVYAGVESGSAYIFQMYAGRWSQQQKLVADDLMFEKYQSESAKVYGEMKVKFFGTDVSIGKSSLAIGMGDPDNKNSMNSESIYIFNGYSSNRWSVQQKLFHKNDSVVDEKIVGPQLDMRGNTLIATVSGTNVNNSVPYNTSTYIFKTFGNGWSQLQRLKSPYIDNNREVRNYSYLSPAVLSSATFSFSPLQHSMMLPWMWGGHLAMPATHAGELQVLSPYHSKSCLWLWMSDHFLDGWDTAVLTVRAPDTSNDTFHPHCDQVDPFWVRYCPFAPEDEGIYIIKVFAATQARFFWEISWKVYVESTGEWYRGDYASKMKFNFNKTTMSFNFVEGENLVDLSAPCYRCVTVAYRSWQQMQATNDGAFWPLVAIGAPYYISDGQGREVFATGKVCDGVTTYECYQTLKNGVYILRLGGGLFRHETGFPYSDAGFHGCGVNGTDRHQFIFSITDNVCKPLQLWHYANRCDRPRSILYPDSDQTMSAGTFAPTQSVFGPPYDPHSMYNVKPTMDHNKRDNSGSSNPALSKLSKSKKENNANTFKTSEFENDDMVPATDSSSFDHEQLKQRIFDTNRLSFGGVGQGSPVDVLDDGSNGIESVAVQNAAIEDHNNNHDDFIASQRIIPENEKKSSDDIRSSKSSVSENSKKKTKKTYEWVFNDQHDDLFLP